MPSFMESLKRKSRASFHHTKTSATSTTVEKSDSSTGGSNDLATGPYSTTVNSSVGSTTPPISSPAAEAKPAHSRRPNLSSSSSRYSVSGMTGLGFPAVNGSNLPTSPYAPRVHNIRDGGCVFQKFNLCSGMIGDLAGERSNSPIDGTLTVTRLDEQFPPQTFPVFESYFKALLFFVPGINKFRLDFTSPKFANSNSTNPIHSTFITINMIPMTNSPPLQLVILQAKDSPGTFDAPPTKIEKEGNGIEIAIKKFRMAAYLWQAFTSEEMDRAKMGRRVFRLEEEWQVGTSSIEDTARGTMRSEARIHVIKCDKTVAELRSPNIAQQNPDAAEKNGLFNIAMDAVKGYFNPRPGQKLYATVLLLDSHWDKQAYLLTGHTALGGGAGDIQLAVFGSHALHSYPSCVEDVVPAFTDCTLTDTDHVVNDCNESGSSWEAAAIGIGAHMHETGHLFGCPHEVMLSGQKYYEARKTNLVELQVSGVMLRDYTVLNRTFTVREPFSTRTQSKGGLVLKKDECSWHRLDLLRFRHHPCFRLPQDPPPVSDSNVQAWPVENGRVMITAKSGVSFTEIYTEGEDMCQTWIEYGDGTPDKPYVKQVVITELDIRRRLPEEKKKAKISLQIKSVGGGNLEISDFCLLASKASSVKLTNGQMAFRSAKLGFSQLERSEKNEVIFDSILDSKKLLWKVKVYHGFALDGIELMYEDATSQLFGKRGGKPGGDTFALDVRRSESIIGFIVRGGVWIDGIQILTSLGRKSDFYGNPNGGSAHVLLPPNGYKICGISGSCGQWVDGFSLIITR